jgi:SAM-dependent methyltransferase
MPDTLKPVSKYDIINRLIAQFGFQSYLEYNKIDGTTHYERVVCANKEIAYIPENCYLDRSGIEHLLEKIQHAKIDKVLPFSQLQKQFAGRKFDLIFFDPVHVRPEVDLMLIALAQLLSPGGILVVHDCNPKDIALTTLRRRPGQWVGETYKAFALFRFFNRAQTITIAEDFGVGLIWNQNLQLDYSVHFDLDYYDFAASKQEYIGLVDYQYFLDKTETGSVANLFTQPRQLQSVILREKEFDLTHLNDVPPQPAASKESCECQLFWRSQNEVFSEAKSLCQNLILNGIVQVVNFTFPVNSNNIEQIRFDIADQRMAARLDAINLFNQDGQVIWQWSRKPSEFLKITNCKIMQVDQVDPVYYVLTQNDDPHFYISIPIEISVQLREKYRFEFSLVPQPPVIFTLLSELSSTECHPVQVLRASHARLLDEILNLHKQATLLTQRSAQLQQILLDWRSNSG